jgi:hypothetical protein
MAKLLQVVCELFLQVIAERVAADQDLHPSISLRAD